MPQYDIKIMTMDHVGAVHAIEEATFATPWSRDSIEREVNGNPCARYLVIMENETVLGYAGMWLVMDEAHITNVAIRGDRRGEGLGEMLMRALVQLAADSGMNWMTLEVRASNAAAQGLYKKLGFFNVGRRKNYYEDNHEDAILMALEDLPEGNPENDPFAVFEEEIEGDLTDIPTCDTINEENETGA